MTPNNNKCLCNNNNKYIVRLRDLSASCMHLWPHEWCTIHECGITSALLCSFSNRAVLCIPAGMQSLQEQLGLNYFCEFLGVNNSEISLIPLSEPIHKCPLWAWSLMTVSSIDCFINWLSHRLSDHFVTRIFHNQHTSQWRCVGHLHVWLT